MPYAEDAGRIPLGVQRELSLQALHADLLNTLGDIQDQDQADVLRDVVQKLEELVSRDTEARTVRLHELDDKQRQLMELHHAVQQQDAEEVQAITEMCRDSMGHLIAECRFYHEELSALRDENHSLRHVKTEIAQLRKEGQEVAAALTASRDRISELESECGALRDKAETLALHLVQTVKERQDLEEASTDVVEVREQLEGQVATLEGQVRTLEGRLSSYEEAAQADIEELAARDKQLSEQVVEKTKTAESLVSQMQNLQLRSDKLASELSVKCNEVQHYRQQLSDAEAEMRKQRTAAQAASAADVDKLRTNLHHVTKELTEKCEQVSALTIKLNSAKEVMLEKDKLLDRVRGEAVRLRDLAEEQRQAHQRAEETLQGELRSRDQRYTDAVQETARLRAAEDSHRHSLEEIRSREVSRAARDAAETDRLREAERVLEKERRAKEELAQTVLELQRQTIELAQEKGRLCAEVARSRSTSHASEPAAIPASTTYSQVERHTAQRSYSPTLTHVTQHTASIVEHEVARTPSGSAGAGSVQHYPTHLQQLHHLQQGYTPLPPAEQPPARSLAELEGELLKVRDELQSLGKRRTSPVPT